jgi:chromosome segregation ATPase
VSADVAAPANLPDGDFKEAIVDARRARHKSQQNSATLLQSLPAGTLDLPDALSSAKFDLTTDTDALGDAEKRLKRAQQNLYWSDDTESARDELQSAQHDLNEFRDYNFDHFWQHQVDHAEQDLAKAEAAIVDEQAAVDRATSARDQLHANIAAEQAQIAELSAQLSPYQDTIDAIADAIADADTDAAVHSLELDRAQKSWTAEFDSRTVTAHADQRSVEACRAWGTSGLGTLSGTAALAVVSLLVAAAARPRKLRPETGAHD